MTDIIETNIATMERDISDLKNALKMVQQDMGGMFESVTELNGTWSGPANAAFTSQFQQDRQTFNEVCSAISGVISSMENAKESYKKCETEVSQEINQIQI